MTAERAHAARAALDGEYEIVRELGVGGTAIVYLARERVTGEEVAVKLIRATFLEDEEALARFAREARYASRLAHPNVVPIRKVFPLQGGGVALVMAHVPGQTLKRYIHEHGKLPVERAERILRDVAAGLSAAHALDIIHRDVKPENIFIDAAGHALLADFGLARSAASTDTQLTMTGVAVGTPTYMPPEQIDSAVVDARGDIYSLGLVCWQMLTGKRPWDGDGLYALLYHQKHDYLPDVREFRSDVPDRLADVIGTAIQKDPEKRWQNVGEMIAALDGEIPARPENVAPLPASGDTLRVKRVDPTPVESFPAQPVAANDVPPDLAAVTELAHELEDAELESRSRSWGFVVGMVGLVALILAVVAIVFVRSPSPAPRVSDSLAIALASAKSNPASDSSAVDSLHRPSGAPVTASADSSATRAALDSATGETVAQPTPDSRQSGALTTTLAGTARPPKTVATPQPAPPATPPASSVPASVAKPQTSKPSTNSRVVTPAAESAAAPRTNTPSAAAARAIVVAGGMHTCLIAADEHAYCMGANTNGQLGAESNTRSTTLTPVGGNLALTTLAAGLFHSCALAEGGLAWCWGNNEHGQLGDRSSTAHSSPVRVADGHQFHAITAGASHTCALDGNGTAWCWGAGSHGQLGNGSTSDASAPVSQRRQQFTALAAGWDFTCGLDGAGKAYCWGENSSGQLGTRDTLDRVVPTPVASPLSFVAIAAGAGHACGVTAQGEAYCWGKNSSGQLGDGTLESRLTPSLVKGDARFVSITAGAMHTCAVDTNGQARCWGLDSYGQLGDGSNRSSSQPVLVAGGHRFSALRAFGSHTCGSTPTGDAFCWGYNLEGQLGDGTRTNRSRPVYLEPPSGK